MMQNERPIFLSDSEGLNVRMAEKKRMGGIHKRRIYSMSNHSGTLSLGRHRLTLSLVLLFSTNCQSASGNVSEKRTLLKPFPRDRRAGSELAPGVPPRKYGCSRPRHRLGEPHQASVSVGRQRQSLSGCSRVSSNRSETTVPRVSTSASRVDRERWKRGIVRNDRRRGVRRGHRTWGDISAQARKGRPDKRGKSAEETPLGGEQSQKVVFVRGLPEIASLSRMGKD